MPKDDPRARILERAEREKVKFMRLQFTDILGTIKNVEIPDRQFEEALDGRIMFDGSSIEGFVRIEESDMYLKPDLSTFQVLPWSYAGSERVARIICDIANPDGTKVYTFAEGKKLLGEKKKINYEGASSRLDFDKYGDVTPDFGVSVVEKGQLVRRDVISI